jgi:predicted nucleotidyltransferase
MIGKLNQNEITAVKAFRLALINTLGNRLKKLLLFGSKARGNFNAESDIDILALVDKSDSFLRAKINSAVTSTLINFSVLLSVKIVEESHFAFLQHLESAFVKNLEREGISIE